MNTHRLGSAFAAASVALALAMWSPAPAQTPTLDNGLYEIQARGLVHEAFAQPFDVAIPQPGLTVPQQPPPPLQEEPPDLRPEGVNVQWIGGYWAWDADINNFMWISGGFRETPPGQQYVAGYWQQTTDGWRWVSGFWAPQTQSELQYVPQLPPSQEQGPTGPPPGDDHVYSPGNWAYANNNFAWQPGSYVHCQPGFVWIPPHYVWTPCGYLLVNGYFDVAPERIGVLFAPVVFRQPLWQTPGWAWRPQYALQFSALFDSFFIDFRFGHYRFGDYYGSNYFDRGIRPWYAYGPQRYDPFFNHFRRLNRGNPGWQNGLARRYDDRLAGRQPLPPRTLALQTQFLQKNNNVNFNVVQPLNQLNDKGLRLTKVSPGLLAQQQNNAKQLRDVSVNRFKKEAEFAKGPSGKANIGRSIKIGELTKGVTSKDPLLTTPKGINPKLPNLDKKGSPSFTTPAKNLPPSPAGKTLPPTAGKTQPPTGVNKAVVPPPTGKSTSTPPTTGKGPPQPISKSPPTTSGKGLPPTTAKTLPPTTGKASPPTTAKGSPPITGKGSPPLTNAKGPTVPLQKTPPMTAAKAPVNTPPKAPPVQASKSAPQAITKAPLPQVNKAPTPPTAKSMPPTTAKAPPQVMKAPPKAVSKAPAAVARPAPTAKASPAPTAKASPQPKARSAPAPVVRSNPSATSVQTRTPPRPQPGGGGKAKSDSGKKK